MKSVKVKVSKIIKAKADKAGVNLSESDGKILVSRGLGFLEFHSTEVTKLESTLNGILFQKAHGE